MNKIAGVGLLFGATVLIGLAWVSIKPNESDVVVSPNGLHWHATLVLHEGGQEVAIPNNLGIGTVHQPIHTHEDGLVHMEFEGRVTEEDLMLGNFFSTWGKTLNASTTVAVNGIYRPEGGHYVMRDGDKIEVSY